MSERSALWVSTSTQTRGGIATYVRELQQTDVWSDWRIRHITTHVDGPKSVKLAAFVRGAVQFIVELIKSRPAVIHLHSSADASFLRKSILFWISRPFNVPVILHMHGSDFQDYYERSPRPIQELIRRTLSRASAVVALGEVWADRLRAIAPSARITVIPNAVRPAPRVSQPAPGEPVHVVFLGRIGDRKGAFRLVDAWAQVSADGTQVGGSEKVNTAILTIAGDGEVEKARRRIRDLGLGDTVELHEWLSQQAVCELLDRAQVLVLPSRSEGQPMAVLEAMARGLCIVSSDVGGLAEMIGGGHGVIVPPDDVEAIAAALLLVIRNDDFRVRCGAAAYARCEDQFDVRTVSRQIDCLYRQITGSATP
ncbi:glycosyltransferase family 4 protein [Mycobacterium neglectum]|uniref:glycosyltransferase family 4 protein n=1 Tax=Mycobacterium neglectum TaxID=242737 RepID=UPI000BFEB7B6|nr:glycosyltransferase family 4 protein [Mycobacterium neglectum]